MSSQTSAAPASLRPAVDAVLTYQLKSESFGLNYERATLGGSGFYFGALSDVVAANLTREFGKNVAIGLQGSYSRNAGIAGNGATTSIFGGAQLNRRFGQQSMVFLSYTAMNQSSSSSLPSNTLNGPLHVISFGIGFSSREKRLRR
jgi:hypothetical protein